MYSVCCDLLCKVGIQGVCVCACTHVCGYHLCVCVCVRARTCVGTIYVCVCVCACVSRDGRCSSLPYVGMARNDPIHTCGVVTITAPSGLVLRRASMVDMCSSLVPGGVSTSR